MCVYVCMYVCIYVYIYIYLFIYLFIIIIVYDISMFGAMRLRGEATSGGSPGTRRRRSPPTYSIV